jgi:hypothetical protein
MSYLSDYCKTIRSWIDDESEYSDDVVTQWVRDGEERMNNELRAVEQVAREYATFDDNCAALPDDWLELIYVRHHGGSVFRYVTPDAYWQFAAEPQTSLQQPDPTGASPWPAPGAQRIYTIIGKTLFILPAVNPELLTKIEVCYFRAVTPLGDAKDAVFDRYPAVYRNCVLSSAAPYLIEDERLTLWATLATAAITKANERMQQGRWSGSPLAPVVRGFG